MNGPFISVVIPTYNRPDFLCELMESLYRQTFKDFEVIVVNDCGESVDFIKELYPELMITVVTMDENSGHVYARNKGVSFARGELIMLCDDDDLILPGHMERMAAEIEGVTMVYSDVEIFDFVIRDGVRFPVKRFVFAYQHDLEAMKKFSTFVSSGCLYRRFVHDEIGLFDPEMHHYWDWDFFLRVSSRYAVKRVEAAGALYAFSNVGENMSANLEDMTPYLARLSHKHQLGPLPTKNFFLLLEEPDVKARRAETEILWNGEPFISRRYALQVDREGDLG